MPESESAPAAAPPTPHIGFPVVGFGASAGGIAALLRVFEHLPADSGMAFVVVMHLSPTHDSALSSILQNVTTMPVLEVTQQVTIQPDTVYVISPSSNLSMADNALHADDVSQPVGHRLAIDLFFRSLAEAHREMAIGVVLSGSGSDGTQGLKRLKELGGVTIAQSPDDAEFDSMPHMAIATGLVDVVAPAAEIAERLLQIWRNARHIELPSPPPDLAQAVEPGDTQKAEEALSAIQVLLRQRTGHDFSHYKRATVLRRLERRLQVTVQPSLPAYLQYLRETPAETGALLQDMLISVTNFFRDADAFEALEQELRKRSADEPEKPGENFRAWVVGCATGEEAYSLAIVLAEAMAYRDGEAAAPPNLFASDIDQQAIDVARAGLYPDSILTDVPLRRMHHFVAEPGGYRIAKRTREMVLFSNHNVLHDPPFTRLDLVSCRNLLIYLDRQAQAQVLRTLHYALRDGGLLLLGSSESADIVDGLFTVVDARQRLYRRLPSGRGNAVLPLLTASVSKVTPALPPRRHEQHPMAALHQRVLAREGPATVLIDSAYSVLHVDERAAHLLRMPGGAPSNKLLDLVRPELRLELRTALFRANETSRSVKATPATLTVNGETRHLAISVRPVRSETAGSLMLVVFNETDITMGPPAGPEVDIQHPLLTALEAELLRMHSELDDTAGDSAALNEEMRASNEELQSINEELRSATEELETSREELQSVNEELVTVNQELRYKIEETAKAHDDLQNLVTSTEIGAIFVDRGMRIKMFTPRAADLFNLIDTDHGRSLLDLTHRLHYHELADDVAEIFRSLSKIEREVRGLDGRRYLVRAKPYRTGEDRIDGAVLTFVDVTDLRRAEQNLTDTEQRLRMVAQSMLDYAIITFDVAGLVTSWSLGAERMFGYAEAEAVGQPAELIFTPEDRRNGVAQAEMRQARETGRAEDDRWHQRKNGQTFLCSGVMTPLLDGELRGYAKIGRDMTNTKLMEAQRDAIQQAEVEGRGRLEEVSVMKDELMAVLAHELKNPLNLISLNTELMLRMPQIRNEASVLRAASTIRNAVRSQSQIIDDLFDMSRLNARKLVLSSGRVELRPIVERIADAVQSDASAKRQTIDVHIGDDAAVFADVVRVEQIVWNLVTNALKFSPQGGRIGIAVNIDGDMARIEVSDTGIGLQPDHIHDVFEMFRQIDSGPMRSRGGLGIGLALVKRMAELHGGRVAAASPGLNQGSTFSVWLPLDLADVPLSLPDERSQILQGMRILLVDDEVDATTTFGELLRLDGAIVTAANAAQDALQLALSQPFDLMLSDIAMPMHDGYWLIGEIRQHERTRALRAIAVSGLAMGRDHKRALDAGFDLHLGKPLQLDALKEAIEQVMAPPKA